VKLLLSSIRVRLLFVSVGVLCVGFIALTLVAGQQISSAARADYEQRLKNEIKLIAQGIRTLLDDETASEEALVALLADYEADTGGILKIYILEDDHDRPPRNAFENMPEVETAMRGEIVIVERVDEGGHDALYTAASISRGQRTMAIVQLVVPLANLQALVWQRWASLWLIFALIMITALVAALLLSRSIIRPLYALRESAVQLSKGDFSHRVAYHQPNEIGEVARAFNEMAHQVESMLEEQRAFASNTSHELRTPLTTIRLRSEALRYDEGLEPDIARQYIAEIDDEANRMGALIEDLTVLSRFDAGRAELGDQQLDLGQFAASLYQRMLPQAKAKNLDFTMTPPHDALPIRASLNHFMVVFRNLIDNAIKYTPDEGKITWHLSAGVEGVCSIIQDNGRGVDPVQLPHLFERFYRADKSRSRDIPGSGLGLAIVKSIVDAYGGTITVESEGLGRGTKVTVFWPYRT
jgi:signal transduction histidine kinase